MSSSCCTYGTKRLNTLMRIKLSCWLLYQHLKTWIMTRITGQKWKCWVLWGKAKIRCFSQRMHKTVRQQLLYNRLWVQFPLTKHIYIARYSKQQNCRYPKYIGCIIQSIILISGYLIAKPVMNNGYSECLCLFQIKL